uniref:Uncharacterized protein n=1 Tax=Ixodes ricinus TaxID=34613 RepID=A0A0K8RGT1_IXORI
MQYKQRQRQARGERASTRKAGEEERSLLSFLTLLFPLALLSRQPSPQCSPFPSLLRVAIACTAQVEFRPREKKAGEEEADRLLERRKHKTLLTFSLLPRTRLRLVFTTSKKVDPPFPPDDVIEVSCCRQLRSWRRANSCGLCGRHLFCCRSLSSVAVHRSFGSQELGHRDDSDTPVWLCYLQLLVGISTTNRQDCDFRGCPALCEAQLKVIRDGGY